MKLKENISWLMGRLQRQLFPSLEECCVSPLTKQKRHLVKVIELGVSPKPLKFRESDLQVLTIRFNPRLLM